MATLRKKKTSSGLTETSVISARFFLIGTVVLLLAIGAIFVFSASSVYGYNASEQDVMLYFKRHLIWIAMGILVAAVVAAFPTKLLNSNFVWVLWTLLVVLLLIVQFAGTSKLGATRSIEIGSFSLQPSELAKIVLLLVAAHLTTKFQYGSLALNKYIILMVVSLGFPLVLILFQPDLGTTIIAGVAVIAVLWFGEMPRWLVSAVIGIIVVLGIMAILCAGFRSDRIYSWLHPMQDMSSQLVNGFYAFSDGGLFGVGLGNSTQKYLYLAYSYNDFIFAIIGEETGFVGCAFIVFLFLVFAFASFRIGNASSSMHARIVANCSGAVIVFQALLNMACTTGLFPITGKPLPFISYGGSSMLTTMILVGLTVGVSLHCTTDEYSKRREDIRVFDGVSLAGKSNHFVSDGFSSRGVSASKVQYSHGLNTSYKKGGYQASSSGYSDKSRMPSRANNRRIS